MIEEMNKQPERKYVDPYMVIMHDMVKGATFCFSFCVGDSLAIVASFTFGKVLIPERRQGYHQNGSS